MTRRFSVEEYKEIIDMARNALDGTTLRHEAAEIAFKAIIDSEIEDLWRRRSDEELKDEYSAKI